jgi:hypothetical protein
MRSAAQKTILLQDNMPSNGTVYMPNMDKGLGSMMKALKDWEKRRGLSLSYKGKFIAPKEKAERKPKAQTEPKTPKDPTPKIRPITVPRERKKPGRAATLSKEERKRRKNECNRLYRAKNREAARERSRQWRAKASPEQKALQLQRVKDWRAKQRAAKSVLDNQTGSVLSS